MNHSSYIEISRNAYKNNLYFIKNILGDKTRFCSVVKGNAYGHGIDPFVRMAFEEGVDCFAVFSAEEAYEVFQIVGNKARIIVMGLAATDSLEWLITHQIEFFVFNMVRLEKALEISRKFSTKALLHIELETGLNRTGYGRKEMEAVTEILLKNKGLYEVKAFCTHLGGAESIANHVRITKQLRVFGKMVRKFSREDITPECLHSACSAAAMNYPSSRMDLARVGIAQYGYWPTKETMVRYVTREKLVENPFHRLISWKSKLMDVKIVPGGEFIGYGTSYLAEKEMRIGIIPVGYAEGYSRSLSNQGRILIRGNRLSVVGMVNMNHTIVNLTEFPEIQREDEVVLIGSQGGLDVSVASFGEMTNLLNYELLARLSRKIPRKIVH